MSMFHDKGKSGGKAPDEKLPRWDLSDLYTALDAPELEADLKKVEKDFADFAARWRGKVAGLDGKTLGQAVAEYEAINETLAKVWSYGSLATATRQDDMKAMGQYQNIQERLTRAMQPGTFFTLEINKIEDAQMAALAAAPELARYAGWLRDTRASRAHDLSEDLEKLFQDKSLTAAGAWNRLYDETMVRLRFHVDGKELTESEILLLLTAKEEKTRKAAAEEFSRVLKENADFFALVTNTLAKDKEISDRWRGYKRPVSSRNKANCVEDEVVDALAGAVSANYGKLSHRYYALKAKWLGKAELEYWDRNAPLPGDDDSYIPWEDARKIVLDAYKAFSPEIGQVAQKFFDNPWIDAPPAKGKRSGAFAASTVPSAHPYMFLNYQGKARDVMTLAHELGHNVHQWLARKQGLLQADTPLTLAETASVFGEMMTFKALLKREKDPVRRQIMIAKKVEDMLATVVRQISFHQFETTVHEERRTKGELSAGRLNEIWLDTQRAALGPAVKLPAQYGAWWSYIPHFIHTPFYVYAYAFGDCLVNSLYQVHEEGKVPDFQKKYIAMLESGGKLHHKELLAPFGLDASKPDFWNKGLKVIEGLIDELEKGPSLGAAPKPGKEKALKNPATLKRAGLRG